MKNATTFWKLTPAILVSSNANNCQDRPPPLPNILPDEGNPNSSHEFLPVLIRITSSTPHGPHPLELEPQRVRPDDIEAWSPPPLHRAGQRRGSREYVLSAQAQQRVRALSSHFSKHEARFAHAMSGAGILAPILTSVNAKLAPGQEPGQHPLIQAVTDGHLEAELARFTDARFETRAELEGCLQQWYTMYARAMARADAILFYALGACAILAGMAPLPWPADPRRRGAYYPPSMITSNLDPIEYCEGLRKLRRLESWGIPIWSALLGAARWDFMPNGLPQRRDDRTEREMLSIGRKIEQIVLGENTVVPSKHTVWTRTVVVSSQQTQSEHHLSTHPSPSFSTPTSTVTSPSPAPTPAPIPPTGYLPLPSDPQRVELLDAILGALREHNPISFRELSSVAGRVLGSMVWNDEIMYEQGLHPLVWEPGQPWKRTRDINSACQHVGVILATFSIPPTASYPDMCLATRRGEYRLEGPAKLASAPVVPRGDWVHLHVQNLAAEDESRVEELAKQDPLVCGWAFGGLRYSPKAASEPTPSRQYRARFVFKMLDDCSVFINQLQQDFQSQTFTPVPISRAPAHSYNQITWRANPHYLDWVYEMSMTCEMRSRLIDWAPPYDVLRRGLHPSDHSQNVQAVRHALRTIELFQYNIFPPMATLPYAGPTTNNSGEVPTSSSPPLHDLVVLPLSTLVKMAVEAESGSELTTEQTTRFWRLVILLEVLSGFGVFDTRLVYSQHSPYPHIMAYIFKKVKNHPTLYPDCRYMSGPTRIDKPRLVHEGMTLDSSRMVYLQFNESHDTSKAGCVTPEELTKWQNIVELERETVLLRPPLKEGEIEGRLKRKKERLQKLEDNKQQRKKKMQQLQQLQASSS
ncbi:hypothetical protein DL93DRAFT_2174421 [Clavulina sp. PMI_390]|nr:hypothetical protein DL93DRAFT_2174421 [Clavulina sp. PMI_390]